MPYQIYQLGNPTPTAGDHNTGWGWALPSKTTKISGYDFTDSHHGIDIGTVENTPLYAVTAGVVQSAGYNDGYGNLLILKTNKDNHNALIYYGHMNSFSVTPGTSVQGGQLIGYSGGKPGNPGAGNSSGPHLHFEIRNQAGGWFNPHTVYPGVYPGGTVAPGETPPGDGTSGTPTGEPGTPEGQENFWIIHLPNVSIPVVGTVKIGDIKIAKPLIPWGDIGLGVVGLGFIFVGVIGIARETGITQKVGETATQAATVAMTGGVV